MATLFFSYSQKDEDLRNELEVHLAMLKREWAWGGGSANVTGSLTLLPRGLLNIFGVF